MKRADHWQRVEPGHIIRAGQPYRAEFVQDCSTANVRITENASESVRDRAMTVPSDSQMSWFIDSSWKPPLVLPTEPTWGIAVHKNNGEMLGRWHAYDGTLFLRTNVPHTTHRSLVLDFIPLTEEQVQRIEAAR